MSSKRPIEDDPSSEDLEDVLTQQLNTAVAKRVAKRRKKAPTTTKASPKQTSTRKPSTRKKSASQSTESPATRRVIVNWSDPTLHHLTDAMLTKIEDSSTWRQAFGFQRGSGSSSNTSQGKKLPAHFADLAAAIFCEPGLPYSVDQWKKETIEDLASSVKNRLNFLKSHFKQHFETLGETGHGLIMNDSEDQLIEGSNIANAWDAVKNKFPWYIRMGYLLGTSPVVDRGAVANSKTQLDLSCLASNDAEASSDESDDELPANPSHNARKDRADASLDVSPQKTPSKPRTPSPPPSSQPRHPTGESSTPSAPPSRRRATMGEILKDALIESRKTTLAAATARNEARLAAEERQAATAIQIEEMRLRAQAEQRAHDILMIEKQLELERLRHGILPSIQPGLS